MGRKSTIDQLEPEIREKIAALRQDGRTIDDILDKLRELDVPVSRSALGRHVQSLDQIQARIQESRAVAEALVARVGDKPENRTAQFNIELMHGMIMRLLSSLQDGAALDPEQTMFLARALQQLASAQKVDLERAQKIRAEERKRVEEEAQGKLEEAGKKAGLTTETLETLKTDVFGVGEA